MRLIGFIPSGYLEMTRAMLYDRPVKKIYLLKAYLVRM